MRRLFIATLLAATLVSSSAAPVRPRPAKAKSSAIAAQGHRRPASRSDALQQAKAGRGTKSNFRRVVVRRMVHGRWVKVSRVVRLNTGPAVQQRPDSERLGQIQKALAAKGYFKGDPNGAWNADSVAALKRFQMDRNLAADGKINALSLIGLGLGPKHEGSIAPAQ